MITTEGKVYVKRYLAQQVPAIAQSIGFGIGDKAEAVGDTKLQFEIGRTDINLVSYDFVNNKLIFKASVPDNIGGKIYEAALFSLPASAGRAEAGSRLITTFDSATEVWVDATSGATATYDATNARIGSDAIRHTPAASGSKTDALKDIALDLSGYSAADKFVLALNAGNSFTSTVTARFLTDTSNYYQISFGSPTVGYNVVESTKGSATVTGSPSWANITEVRVTTNSTAGGASQIDFDGLRLDDSDTISADDIMVSRELLATPFVKIDGMTQEIEFALDVSV